MHRVHVAWHAKVRALGITGLQNKPLQVFCSHLTFIFVFWSHAFVYIFSGPNLENVQMVAAVLSDLHLDVYDYHAKIIVCHH